MAMMGVFLVAMQPASATSKTEIKVYKYDIYAPPGTELDKDFYIKKGDPLDLAATLHVNGGNPQWFRNIHLKVYNSKGEQLVNQKQTSSFGGEALFYVKTKNWDSGTYKICMIYEGNKRDGYPRAEKEIILHIN